MRVLVYRMVSIVLLLIRRERRIVLLVQIPSQRVIQKRKMNHLQKMRASRMQKGLAKQIRKLKVVVIV